MTSKFHSTHIGSIALLASLFSFGLAGCGPSSPDATAANGSAAVAVTAPAATVPQQPTNATVGQPVPPVSYAPPAPQRVATVAPPAISAAHRGTISNIEPINERPSGTGTGAVIGGVLGAVVGNQFGHGNGRAAMTVLGGAGGAVAGNNVERNVKKHVVAYRVSVRLDNGEARSFEEPNLDGLRVGDRVRIDGDRVRRS